MKTRAERKQAKLEAIAVKAANKLAKKLSKQKIKEEVKPVETKKEVNEVKKSNKALSSF